MIPGLQTRVINLDRSRDRLDLIAPELDVSGLAWSRLRAIEPNRDNYLHHERYNRQNALKYQGADMTRGELGCFLSHLDALQTFLASEASHLLVLEDDVTVSAKATADLAQILLYLRSEEVRDWDCLNLTEAYLKRRRLLHVGSFGRIFRAFYFPMLASGLLWSRAGAERFLSHVTREGIFLAVDQQLRFHLARTGGGLSLETPLLTLRSLPTTIRDRDTGPKENRLSKLRRKGHNYLHAYINQMRG